MTSPVYLFGTCLLDLYDPLAGMDAAKLLEFVGHQVIFPQDQSCCGQPPYNSGYANEAKAVAAKQLSIFGEQSHPLIVPSASCAAMFKHHYPALFAGSPLEQKALSLAERTFELLDFIADKLPYDSLRTRPLVSVALHISCSARREMRVAERWLEILNKMPNISATEPAYAQECCGFGGTFAVKSPDISAKMTRDKASHLENTGADLIISGDGGCLLSLGGYLEKSGSHTRVMHVNRFLARQFKL